MSEVSPLGHKKTWTYDQAGRKTSEVDARGNETGANPNSYRTQYVYDAMNRLVSTTDPLGHATVNSYDAAGNLLTTTNAIGASTTYEYDAANRLTLQTNADGGSASRQYDAQGRLVARQRSNGKYHDVCVRCPRATGRKGDTAWKREWGQPKLFSSGVMNMTQVATRLR